MSDIKQVKVDNWGIYFLQRLKHFFNRTDYCDLTLQFQDNAQLKVHRLVLSACTEYFELLERTCEMYEDCLVMPDDLQADVVVPIVNFMYTGQLDFKPELLEKLYHTSQVMNMPVLTKLLDAHRSQSQKIQIPPAHDFRNVKSYSKSLDSSKQSKSLAAVASTSYMPSKRSYSKAFNNVSTISKIKRPNVAKPIGNKERPSSNGSQQTLYPEHEHPIVSNKNQIFKDPRPTRYELPEELDVDNVFESSFTNISYTSTPLMVHPETVKRYSSKKNANFEDGSNSKRFIHSTSTIDIVECKKINSTDNIFDDEVCENSPDDIFASISVNSKDDQRDANQLFDQILDSDSQKSSIDIQETEKSKPKLDHAKIISEVLKKYPHLMKSNKNIKLKILNTPNKGKKSRSMSSAFNEEKELKPKVEPPDFTYETDVIDSKQAAKLIAMGAENIKGPWICLICGTPGRALHFTSYYKFRRHLVDVHNEKPIPNFCEYCGLKSLKRNYSFHHLYTKHGIPPPSHYNFPKCNYCNYIALTEAYLVKHKLTHIENKNFGCNVCAASFNSSNQLLVHIQNTGHKYSADRKINLQCIYCFKTFSRQTNLYTHLKVNHKESAAKDGIIDDSDDEKHERTVKDRSDKIKTLPVKYEIPVTFENEYENIDVQYQIEQKADGNIHILPKSPQTIISSAKHKILNPGFNSPSKSSQNTKVALINALKSEFLQESSISLINQNDGVIVVDGNEYIVKDNQLIRKNQNQGNEEFLLTNVISEPEHGDDTSLQTTSIDFPAIQCNDTEEPKSGLKKASSIGPQHIQIVVSNEEEYKALMSANHSIIFDDGDPNKTLTVLTAPQNTTLEGTAIDLDARQPNDMMIIQEEYPLNVTETATVENPNIVVVYSHPVDDQHKQFQYITSQGIEAQFIQSSAMITHNYETVTTSTPVMSAHVMDTHIEESWPNNVKEATETMAIEQVTVAEENFQNSLNPIQESSLPTTETSTIVSDDKKANEIIASPALNHPHEANEKRIDQVLEQEGIENPAINLDINAANEQLEHKEIQTENTNVNVSYDSIAVGPLEDKDQTKQNLSNEKSYDNSNILEKIIFDQSVVTTDVSTTMSITNSTDIHQDKEKPLEKEVAESDIEQTISSNLEVNVSKVAQEQIQNLTSEWTENDLEKELTNDVSKKFNTANANQVPNIMTIDAEGSVYIEESIENIQQEMAKQMEAIETENKTILPVVETKAVISITPPDTALGEINKEDIITEISMQDNVKNNSTSDVLIVNVTEVSRSMPSLTVVPEDSKSDPTAIRETHENILESADHNTASTDQKIVTDGQNISKNVEAENVLPDLEKTLSSPVESPKSEHKNSSTPPKAVETGSKQHTVITLNKTAHEKISSLLNDWEDNDSQHDDSKNEDNLSEEKDDTTDEVTTDKVNFPNNDKIKSLVSDWDDDDDESK